MASAWRWRIALLAIVPTVRAICGVDVIITSDVLGAAYPVDEFGSECSSTQLRDTPCECYGGAARRAAATKGALGDNITSTRASHTTSVAVDSGGFYFGSGTFYPTFNGTASAYLFGTSGYAARSLSYRDFAAGVTAEDPTGGAALAAQLRQALRFSGASPPAAVVTNLNVTGDPYLNDRDLIQPYAIIPLEFPPDDPMGDTINRKMALLSFLDQRDVQRYSPHYAARCLTYERSLTATFAEMARAGEAFDVIVLLVPGVPRQDVRTLLTTFDDDLINSIFSGGLPDGVSTESLFAHREMDALLSMSKKFVDLDLVVISDPTSTLGQDFEKEYKSGVAELENWVGDTTTISSVVLESRRGRAASLIRLELDSQGVVVPRVASRDVVSFDCRAEEDASTRVALDAFKADVEAAFDDSDLGHAGYVKSTIEATQLEKGDCVMPPSASKFSGACGCSVTACPAGNLVADALQWYAEADIGLVAAGALAEAPLEPSQVCKSHLLELLPDLGDEIVVIEGVTGEAIHQILSASVQTIDGTRNISLGTTRELSSKDVYAGREFLQVSNSVQFTWYFQQDDAMVGDDVFVNGVPLDDEDTYTVAVSNRLLAGDAFGPGIGEPTYASSLYGNLLIDERRVLNGDPTLVIRQLGVSHLYAVADYLTAFHPTPETALDPETDYAESRIIQGEDVAVVHVAILCGQTAARRQQCDHALHAVDLVNDHMNGFQDDLLGDIRLVAHERTVGCSRGQAFEGLVDIGREIFPDQLTAVVLTCSADVEAVASVEARAAYDAELSGQGGTYVVVSPSSTAPSLSDEDAYPYLARLATPESEISDGLVALFHEYNWDRAAILHDDSLFATSAAQEFADKARAHSRRLNHDDGVDDGPGDGTADDGDNTENQNDSNRHGDFEFIGGGACLAGCAQQVVLEDDETVGVSFSLDAFDKGELSPTDILDSLTGLGAKIIYISSYPRVQRGLFTESHTANRYNGQGYAWITNLPSVDSLYFDDGTVDLDAVYGAEGSLGFIEHRPAYGDSDETSAYLDLWAEVASTDACLNRSSFVPETTGPRTTYCDIDGDPKTMTGYSAFWVDSVVVLAEALTGYEGLTSGVGATEKASDIYSRIVNLGPHAGVSGTISFDQETGDRVGLLDLVNMQIIVPNERRQRRLRGVGADLEDGQGEAEVDQNRHLLVPLTSTFADYVAVGDYFVLTDVMTIFGEVIFPGGDLTAPIDQVPLEGDSDDDDSANLRVTIALVAACVTFAFVLACAFVGVRWLFGHLKSRHRRALVASLNAYEVIESFDPQAEEDRKVQVLLKSGAEDKTLGEFVVSRIRDVPDAEAAGQHSFKHDEEVKSERPLAWDEPFSLELWYWEDDEPSSGNWVVYDEQVQDLLSETFHRFLQLPDETREVLTRFDNDDEVQASAEADDIEDHDDSGNTTISSDDDEQGRLSISAIDVDPKSHKLLVYLAGHSLSAIPPPPSKTGALPTHKRLEIDIAKMQQVNLDTGMVRNIRMEAGARKVKLTWFWRENLRNMAKWRDNMQRAQGTLWVKYEPEVQRELSKRYIEQRMNSQIPQTLRLDSYSDITTDDHDWKYEVDIGKMWQTRRDTGFRRPVCVMIEAVGQPAAATKAQNSVQLLRGVPTVANMPDDIIGRDCLKLTPGMVVSVVYEHESGEWAFGREIRRNEVVSDDAGWFPMNCVRPARRLEMTDAALDEFRFLLPPRTWTYTSNGPIDQQPKLVTLGRESSKERQLIANLFDADYYDILSVQRVQNISLWRPYATKRMTTLEGQMGIPNTTKKLQRRLKEVEMFPVFHGTHPDTVPKIVEQGFNRDFSSINSRHGRGCYFATESEQSCFHTYSKPDANGIQAVFVCRIIVGSFCRGTPDISVPPPLESNPNQRYDTTVDDETNPSIYVTYNDHQAYPSYLVKFRARPNAD